jgi:hypothetical protein
MIAQLVRNHQFLELKNAIVSLSYFGGKIRAGSEEARRTNRYKMTSAEKVRRDLLGR